MSTQQLKIVLRHISSSLILGVTLVLLLGGCVYMGQKVFSSRETNSILETDISTLNSKADKVLANTTIDQDEIEQFTQLMSRMIPENEDFFSVLLALENLSAQTGFTIVQYQITPSKTVDQKLTLNVRGLGSPESFLTFIENYPFSGGRFITSNVITYKASSADTTDIDLTFYSQKTSSLADENRVLSPQDIAMLRDIQNKTVVSVVEPQSSTESAEYTTKSNPF